MSKNLKTLAFSFLAFMAGVPVFAGNYVKVSSESGEATYFALSQKPVVTFTADYLVLTTDEQTVQYPISSYRSFEFADQPTGINSATAESSAVFSVGSSLKAEGLAAGSVVTVYGVNGQVVGSARASESGSVDIPLHGKTGVFEVKSTSRTFKFIKK